MDNHKSLFTASLIVSVVAVLISGLSLYFLFSITDQVSELRAGADRLSNSVAKLAETCPDSEEVFVLREFEGIIGVFDTSGVLIDVIDVQVISLPEADREMLQRGIYAFSRLELMSLIEDYNS